MVFDPDRDLPDPAIERPDPDECRIHDLPLDRHGGCFECERDRDDRERMDGDE
jgi:hypothetical protein